MSNQALFGDDLYRRVQQAGRLGLQLYGPPQQSFVGDDALARGFECLRSSLPPDRIALVEAKRGNTYGAWNPTILFVGLSAGSKPPPRPMLHQHSIGCPDFFEPEPGARGIWLARTIKELTLGGFRELGARPGFEWLPQWEAQSPDEFLSGAGGAAAVFNFSLEAVRMGGRVTFDSASARQTFLAWLRVFRPAIVVTLKPDVSKALLGMFPDCGLKSHVWKDPDDAARTAIARFDELAVPVITMPIHPTAMGHGINRMKASKPRVSRAIADVLAGLRREGSA